MFLNNRRDSDELEKFRGLGCTFLAGAAPRLTFLPHVEYLNDIITSRPYIPQLSVYTHNGWQIRTSVLGEPAAGHPGRRVRLQFILHPHNGEEPC